MGTKARRYFILQPKPQVIVAWGWNFISVFLIIAVATALLPANVTDDRHAMQAKPGLALIPILAEFIATGMLPVLFTLLQKENPAVYGLHKKGLGNSLLFSTLAVALFAAAASLGIGRYSPVHFADLQVRSAGHLFAFMLGAFAYGPLEAFFVIWLVHNTDRVLHSESKIFSRGLIVTIVIYGLLHATSQGFYAVLIAARYLAVGWIYKATRNAIGPMLAGTLTNEFIWFLVSIFLKIP